MKTSLTLFALTAFAVAAGAQSTTVQGAASATENASAAGQAGQMSASARQATQVSAVLSKGIDSKNAKVGDEVMAKTTSEARLADGTKIPKGSRLVGHVTEVQPKSHENRDGHVAFCFDHAVLKGGQEIPVHVLMRSIAAPAALSASADDSGDMMAAGGGAMAGGGMMAGGSAPRVGGVAGNVAGGAGGALGSTTSMAGGAAAGLAANTRSAADVAGSTTANAAVLVPETSVTGAAGSYAGFSGQVGNVSGMTFATVSA
ncbi:MAG TPA: hypothetical protein VJS11_01975, partial [Acidobacteriaceae bacterium]|nr:hypothetical protein [Acidobacteriaceae bacterium]